MRSAAPIRPLLPSFALLGVGIALLVIGGGDVDRVSLLVRALGVLAIGGAVVAFPKEATPEHPAARWISIPLVLVFAAGVGVRLWVAATETVHYDEGFTYISYANGSIGHILLTYDAPNNHILHTLAVKLATDLFGTDPFAARIPALIGGAATIWFAAAVAAAMAPERRSREAAVLAAAFTAGFPPFIAYSTMARGYTLIAAAGLLALLAALRITSGDQRRRWWVALLVASAGGLLTVPISIMVVGGAWLWLALVLTIRRGWTVAILLRLGVVGVGVVALLATVYLPIRDQPGFDYDWLVDRTIKQIFGVVQDYWKTGWGTAGLVLTLALIAVAVVHPGERAAERRSIAVYLLSLAGAFVIAGTISPFARSYLAIAAIGLPFAAIGVVLLIDHLRSTNAGTAVVAALAVVLVLSPAWGLTQPAWDEDPRRLEDYEGLLALARAHPDKPVLVPWVAQPSWQYYVVTKGDPKLNVVGTVGPPVLLVPMTGDRWKELVGVAGGDPNTYRVVRRWPVATEVAPAAG